jgi:hypothetical protein
MSEEAAEEKEKSEKSESARTCRNSTNTSCEMQIYASVDGRGLTQ